jgi:hypothetical protein
MQTLHTENPAGTQHVAASHDASVLAFCDAAEAAFRSGNVNAVSDAALRRVFTLAVKIYAAKAELHEGTPELAPFDADKVNATETVVATCAMIRAADLNLLDLAMWFGRRPA